MAALDDVHDRCDTCDMLARVAVARFDLALAYEGMAAQPGAWSAQYQAASRELRAASARALELAEQHRLQHGANADSGPQPGERDDVGHDAVRIDQVEASARRHGPPVSVRENPQPGGVDQRDVVEVDRDLGAASGVDGALLSVGKLRTATDIDLTEQQ